MSRASIPSIQIDDALLGIKDGRNDQTPTIISSNASLF